MNRLSMLGSIWCLSLVLSPAFQVGKADTFSTDTTEKLREIVAVLRVFWGKDFESNYRKYMLGSSPTVLLVPREEMRRIAALGLDGRPRDGGTIQGLTIGDKPHVKIVVVYEGLAAILVAKTLVHEIAHFELRNKHLAPNAEEARVRKVVETRFFEKVFGRQWLDMTVAALQKKVLPVEKGGRLYEGHTPEAVETLYEQLRKTGTKIDKSPLHDQILANLVFILTNSEKNLSAALDFDDHN